MFCSFLPGGEADVDAALVGVLVGELHKGLAAEELAEGDGSSR